MSLPVVDQMDEVTAFAFACLNKVHQLWYEVVAMRRNREDEGKRASTFSGKAQKDAGRGC
jgi:hypothetical protein